MIEGELGFKIVKDFGAHDELLALAATLPIARARVPGGREDVPRRDHRASLGARVVERSR
jgi:hypothetical protein